MILPFRQHSLFLTSSPHSKSKLSPQNALSRTFSLRRGPEIFPCRRRSSPQPFLADQWKPILLPCGQHLLSVFRCRTQNPSSLAISHEFSDDEKPDKPWKNQDLTATLETRNEKSFWAAVTLIIGTAVGPGMLGLPAATIRSGSIPSTIAIFLCWVYNISSILLVAELSFAAMEEDNATEVSFTGLATKSLGKKFGAFVALVYASLSFSLLVACVSGIGSIVSQCFPSLNPLLSNSLFPLIAAILIGFFPFKAIDFTNRSLCFLMLFSITSLVAIGLSVARTNVIASFGHSCWAISTVLPAVPVIVLTLGFHVITPFICKIAGDSVSDARKAILVGGVVPLAMVLSWNLIILGLARINVHVSSSLDPIALLLSVNPSALSAVQGFAFSALATSLIGYAVSFPKQLLDTWKLITRESSDNGNGRVGYVSFLPRRSVGRVSYSETSSVEDGNGTIERAMMLIVLGAPALIASFFPSTFSRALDFAGVYANCFLFGVLPPKSSFGFAGHPFFLEETSPCYSYL